jgi:hypothetical protein
MNLCQSNSMHVSDVYHQWKQLISDLKESQFPQTQKTTILSTVTSRWDLLRSPCHTMAYYLDPRYFGYLINPMEKMEADGLIASYAVPPELMENREVAIRAFNEDINNYKSMVLTYAGVIQERAASPSFSVLVWWREYARDFPAISPLAIRLFSLVTSTASVERSFNNFQTHSQPQDDLDS